MRPFISSLGQCHYGYGSLRHMVSCATLDCRGDNFFCFFSASSLACCSISLTIIAVHDEFLVLHFVNKIFLASSNVMPEIRSNSAICFSYKASIFSRLWAKSASLRCKASSLCSILSNFFIQKILLFEEYDVPYVEVQNGDLYFLVLHQNGAYEFLLSLLIKLLSF